MDNRNLRLLIAYGSKGKFFHLKEFSDALEKQNVEVKLVKDSKSYLFTMVSPDELYRRKGKTSVYSPYFPDGNLLVPWSINNLPNGSLYIDDEPISNLKEYVVEKDYYWAMGDNRDDSLDSRFWGFVPRDYILGEALFSYFSLDLML